MRTLAAIAALLMVAASLSLACSDGNTHEPLVLVVLAAPSEDGSRQRVLVIDERGEGLFERELERGHAAGLAAWSPDGTRLAFVDIDEETQAAEVRILDRDGDSVGQFAVPGQSWPLSWSPDGGFLATAGIELDGNLQAPADQPLEVSIADREGNELVRVAPGSRPAGESPPFRGWTWTAPDTLLIAINDTLSEINATAGTVRPFDASVLDFDIDPAVAMVSGSPDDDALMFMVAGGSNDEFIAREVVPGQPSRVIAESFDEYVEWTRTVYPVPRLVAEGFDAEVGLRGTAEGHGAWFPVPKDPQSHDDYTQVIVLHTSGVPAIAVPLADYPGANAFDAVFLEGALLGP